MADRTQPHDAGSLPRPAFIDMPPPPRMPGTMTPGSGSRGGSPLHSPRIPFVTGEGAPAMSPLDAFAAQSRMLQRQLEDESKRVGRRVSRLPHDQVAEQLARRQRHLSPQMRSDELQQDLSPLEEDAGGEKPEISTVAPEFRPKSFYPRFSAVTAPSDTSSLPPMSPRLDEFSTPMEHQSSAQGDYFANGRTASPEPGPSEESTAPSRPSLESLSQSSYPRSQSSFDSHPRQTDLHRGASIESSQSSKSLYANQHGALLPPNPPYARKSPSIRSVDSDSESIGSRNLDQELRRKASSGSGSQPLSPTSPTSRYPRLHRTPSQNSELSINNHRLSKPRFNFSRPISRNEREPSRMSSIDSHTHPRHLDQPLRTPNGLAELQTPSAFNDAQSVYGSICNGSIYNESIYDEAPPRQSEDTTTYTHATYSLPRGRMVSRDSVPLNEMMPTFSWEGKQKNARNLRGPDQSNTGPKNAEQSPAPLGPGPIMPGSFDATRPSLDSIRTVPAPAPPMQSTRNHNMNRHSMTSMSAASMNSGSTIKASSHNKQRSEGVEMTAEDHLAEGIACHEKGSLNKSTYHLRLAANGGNATAMMLYALACRHGWGMRQSPSEGVRWLRQAMESASIEMSETDDTNLTPEERAAKKARKAQFALSVYELGISHLNGWGVEQDKALALKCFEIAASWGDADAMAETGFCYTQGVGCKKDLKKAARYYRLASKKGVSMIGQSWIWKSKYDEEPEETPERGRGGSKDAEKKKRDKSRTRSIFGRKRP